HVTIVHQTKDLHTADYTQLHDFLKYNKKEVDELKSERLAKIQDPLALMANSNNPYASPASHQDQSPFNQNYMQQQMKNPEDITDPTTAMNMALALMAKAFKLNYSTPTNNNQRISSNLRNRQIAQSGMNMGQDRQMQMIGVQNVRNQVAQNPRVQNDGNQNQIGNDDEFTDKELKQIEADDQAIQAILLGLPEDIYTAEKKAKLFNEWERFTSNEGESIESYYHCFLKLMNDLKRNKHFPEKIASNLKFLNNLQPERSRHVTIVHQTKDLHIADYTQLYEFLKYNQKE
nr:hypothetical protein [Tanacetum cinerariifolium]